MAPRQDDCIRLGPAGAIGPLSLGLSMGLLELVRLLELPHSMGAEF